MKIANAATRFAILSILAIFANTAIAGATNIAILDVDDIINNSKAMKYIKGEVNKKQAEYQKEIDKKQSHLASEGKRIESKRGIISEEAMVKEQDKFDEKLEDLRVFVERKQNSLRKASLDSMAKVNEEMKEIIAKLSKEKEIDLVIPASEIIFHRESVTDISEEVLSRLNKSLTKVKVSFES